MRLMTNIGIGEEVGPATYRTNRIVEALTTSPQTAGIHCMYALLGHCSKQMHALIHG